MTKQLLITLLLCSTAFATVTGTDTDNYYTGDGNTTAFAFGFGCFATSEVVVKLITTATGADAGTQVEGTHYTVSATNNDYWNGPGGTVTMVTAPTALQKLYIYSAPPLTQEFNLNAKSTMRTVNTTSTENVLDKIVIQIQYLQLQLDRCIKIPANEVGLTVETAVEPTRDGRFLSWDGDGNISTSAGTGDATAHTAVGVALASASSELVARQAIGADTVYTITDAAYGADGTDDEVAIEAAITAAAVAGGTVFFPPGAWDVDGGDDAIAVASNVTLWFAPGATIQTDSGDAPTVTLAGGGIIDTVHKIIASTVTVTGLQFARPDWFETNTTPGTTDMGPALQLAIEAVDGGGIVKTIPGTIYNLDTETVVAAAYTHITIDFTGSRITNVNALGSTSYNGSGSTAPLVVRASNTHVKGGYWYDMAGQALRAYGVKGSDTYSGSGFIENIKFTDMVMDNVTDDCVIINSFDDGLLHNIVVRDKGDGNDGDHSKEIGFQYGTTAIISNCKVIENDEGGGFYGLTVKNLIIADCDANDITNSAETDQGGRIAYYMRGCLNVLLDNCSAYLPDSGVAIKFSYDCEDVSVIGGYYKVEGADTDESNAGLYIQGVNGVLVEGATVYTRTVPCIYMVQHTTPNPDENTINAIITGNRLHNTYVDGDAGASAGSGVYYSADATQTRAPLKISGNYLYRASILVQSAKDFQVSDNYIYTDVNDPASDASIFINLGTNGSVSNNLVVIDEDSTDTRWGIETKNCVTVRVLGNDVRFNSSEKAGSVAFYNTTSTTTTDVLFMDNISRYAATEYSLDNGSGTGDAYRVGTYTDTVEVSSAEILDLADTPITLVAAQGADSLIEFVSAVFIHDAGTGYAEPSAPDDLVIEYEDGTDVSQEIDSTGFLTVTDDEIRFVNSEGIFPAADPVTTDLVPNIDEALELFNTGADLTTGTGTLTVRITYRVHNLGL